MISRLSGTVWSCADDRVVVRVGGVGFEVHAPTGTLAQLGDPGQPIELFTYLHVRENDLTLYGFPSEEEVALFKLLLSVSGVGPKVALSVLSTTSPETLRQAVAGEEPALLSQVPGVGPKTAKAIIFHLKDKLVAIGGRPAVSLSEDDTEVITALTSVGFSLIEAQTAVQNLPRDEDMPVEERVRLALSYLASH